MALTEEALTTGTRARTKTYTHKHAHTYTHTHAHTRTHTPPPALIREQKSSEKLKLMLENASQRQDVSTCSTDTRHCYLFLDQIHYLGGAPA